MSEIERAKELIAEGRKVLDDPTKADYHERLRAAIERLDEDVSFFEQLAAVQAMLNVANETD